MPEVSDNNNNSVMLNDIIKIWKDNDIDIQSDARIKKEDLETVSIKVSGSTRGMMWYGNYCGPGTGQEGVKIPLDALDFSCKLHDTYYGHKHSDKALAQTADYLIKHDRFENEKAKHYAKMMNSPFFFGGSFCWKNILNITLIILICLFALCAVGFAKCFNI
jgi:hypothetical protein